MTRAPTIPCCRGFRAVCLPLLACLVAAASASGIARSALAAEPVEVENLIRQGVELRQQNRDQAALPFFQRAYDLEQSPRTAGQLGLVQANMGYWLAAERHLDEALASSRHPWVLKHGRELEQTLKIVRASIGEIELVGTPSGGEVLVNGRSEGILPLKAPIRARDGMAQVVVRAPGFEEKQTSVRIFGGKREHLQVDLLPKAGVTKGEGDGGKRSARPRIQQPEGIARADAASTSSSSSASSSAPAWVRPASWVTAGLGAAAIAVGGYGLIAMLQKQSEFNSRKNSTTAMECNSALPDKGSTGCKNIYNDSASAQRLAINGLAAGALLGGAALVGFLWSADHSPSSDAAAPRSGMIAGFDADGASAGWLLRF
jgi:hypothetical protein